ERGEDVVAVVPAAGHVAAERTEGVGVRARTVDGEDVAVRGRGELRVDVRRELSRQLLGRDARDRLRRLRCLLRLRLAGALDAFSLRLPRRRQLRRGLHGGLRVADT